MKLPQFSNNLQLIKQPGKPGKNSKIYNDVR